MADIKSLDQLSLVLGYVVPGLIILYIRAQFLTGRIDAQRDSILSYFTLSVVYLTIVQGITSLATGTQAPLFQQTPYWLPIMLTGAAVFGVLLGLNAGFGVSRWVLSKFGITVPHAIDTAWDFRFRSLPECLVMITLKDGSKVYGWWGVGSFVGSDPANRDIYLVQVYDVSDDGDWELKTRGKGIYIMSGEVRLIEFIPPEAQAR